MFFHHFREKQLAIAGPKQPRPSSERSSELLGVPPAVEPPLETATEHFAVHEDTALQPCEDEVELPVHESWLDDFKMAPIPKC